MNNQTRVCSDCGHEFENAHPWRACPECGGMYSRLAKVCEVHNFVYTGHVCPICLLESRGYTVTPPQEKDND